MEQALEIFKHEEFGGVRVIGDADNPRFCLADVCKILELPQVAKVVQRLDKEVLSTHPLETAGGIQQMYFINEDGLYDVILDSRKPVAKKFRKWITSEVLPLIRKQGMYINPNAPIDPRFLRRMAIGGTATQMKWTQKGRFFLYNTLKKHGKVPLSEREEPISLFGGGLADSCWLLATS